MEHCSKEEGVVLGDGTKGQKNMLKMYFFVPNPLPVVEALTSVTAEELAWSPKRLSSLLIVCRALDAAALQTSCRRLQLVQVAAAGIVMGFGHFKCPSHFMLLI